jgi:hypothetical protein
MKTTIGLTFVIVFFSACADAAPPPTRKSVSLFEAIDTQPNLQPSLNTVFAQRFANTECVDVVQKATKEKVGLICRTADRVLLTEMGIELEEPVGEGEGKGEDQPSKPTVATAMRIYHMEPFPAGGNSAHASTVDCDISNGDIYRATGSCHIAFAKARGNSTIYSNFILKDHIRKRDVISVSQIESIWALLETSLTPEAPERAR